MKKNLLYFSVLTLGCFGLCACATVPLTGRRQLDLVSSDAMLSMSFQQYSEFLKSNKVSTNQRQTAQVKLVGGKIQKAVEEYMARNKLSSQLRNYSWEFNLIENEEANAWCMPGGKVVVYTGILPITLEDSGLAVVMGHEIAHAIARHGNERMSQNLLVGLGGAALSSTLENKDEKTKKTWMTAFGVGSQFGVLLPYSRLHESEADRLGLIFMAIAGYNPHSAVAFWERMSEAKGESSNIEFLSSHPSDQLRVQNIKSHIPEAMTYFEKNNLKEDFNP